MTIIFAAAVGAKAAVFAISAALLSVGIVWIVRKKFT